MAKMKAVQAPKAGADFEIVEGEIPQPDAGQVGRVQACGIWSATNRNDIAGKKI